MNTPEQDVNPTPVGTKDVRGPGVPDVWVKGIGEKRGAPYVYLDAAQALRAGFAPGEKFLVQVDEKRGMVVLTKRRDGTHTVASRKQGDDVLPVIDINSKALLGMFEGMKAIRVIVTPAGVHLVPLASEKAVVERRERTATKLLKGEPLTMGSISHGGGILSHAIHKGLEAAGLEVNLAFANEIREDLLLQAISHNDAWGKQTAALCMPMQELAQDQYVMSTLPKLDILEMGLPCSGASRAGKSKRRLGMMEDHPEVGHLVYAGLTVIAKTQASSILFENVPEYAESASANILRLQLRDMGYVTHEAIVRGKDAGCLEDRVRWTMVAVTRGLEFDFEQIQPKVEIVQRLVADIIDPSIGPDDPRWRTFDYLKSKEERDKAKGNGFGMQVIHPEDTRIPTLRKGYHKGGSTDPLLAHPTNPDLLRLLTVEEHAAAKDVPRHLVAGTSGVMGHEILGQGIAYSPFVDKGYAIGKVYVRYLGELLGCPQPARIRCQENMIPLLEERGARCEYDPATGMTEALLTQDSLNLIRECPADFVLQAAQEAPEPKPASPDSPVRSGMPGVYCG